MDDGLTLCGLGAVLSIRRRVAFIASFSPSGNLGAFMPRKLDFLPDDFQFAIASVACYSSFLDHAVETALDTALSDKKRLSQFILKQGTQGERLVLTLEAILIDSLPNDSKDITYIISEIKRIRSKRNDLFHGLWDEVKDGDNELKCTSMRPHREVKTLPLTLNEIVSLSDDMFIYGEKIIKLSRRVLDNRVLELQQLNDMKSRLIGFLGPLNPDPPDIFQALASPQEPQKD